MWRLSAIALFISGCVAAEPDRGAIGLTSSAEDSRRVASREDRVAPPETEVLPGVPSSDPATGQANGSLDRPLTFVGEQGTTGIEVDLIAEGVFAGSRYSLSAAGDLFWREFRIAQDVAAAPVSWQSPNGPRLVFADDALVSAGLMAFTGTEVEVLALELASAGAIKPAGQRVFFVGASLGGVMGVHVATLEAGHQCLTNCALRAGGGDVGTPVPASADALIVDDARGRVSWRAADGRLYGARFEVTQ